MTSSSILSHFRGVASARFSHSVESVWRRATSRTTDVRALDQGLVRALDQGLSDAAALAIAPAVSPLKVGLAAPRGTELSSTSLSPFSHESPLEALPHEIGLAILSYAVDSNFAMASRWARSMRLEHAIGVVGLAVNRGVTMHNALMVQDAYRFIRGVIFSGQPAVAVGSQREPASLDVGPPSQDATPLQRLEAAKALILTSARQALDDIGVTPMDVHAVRAADRVLGDFLSYVRIDAGAFIMGSPATEPSRIPNEVQHHVRLTRPFMLKSAPVTQQEFFEVMGYNPSRFQTDGPKGEAASARPVENINGFEAMLFLNKKSRLEGLTPCYDLKDCRGTPGKDYTGPDAIPFDATADGYRFPTEAEWEYAARAGTEGATYAGPGQSLSDIAWTGQNSEYRTHPVRKKVPNAWGMHEMIGNVWERTGDRYGTLAEADQANPAVDPHGANTGVYRVFRGGSWYYGEHYARAAYRGLAGPGARYGFLGFRPARSLQD